MKKFISLVCIVAVLVSVLALPALATNTPVATQQHEETVTPRAASYYRTITTCNLRANAGTQYTSYGLLSPGQLVVLQSYKTGTDGYTWYYVSVLGGTLNGYYGYIRSDLLTFDHWG